MNDRNSSMPQKIRIPRHTHSLERFQQSMRCAIHDADEKPWLSYVALIVLALLSSPSRRMKLDEIYQFVEQTFPYYRKRRAPNWRNSIRHNLSLNDCFVKVAPRPDAPKRKGNYWTLHPKCDSMFDQGTLLRRSRRFRLADDQNHPDQPQQSHCSNSLLTVMEKINDELRRWKAQANNNDTTTADDKPIQVDSTFTYETSMPPYEYPNYDNSQYCCTNYKPDYNSMHTANNDHYFYHSSASFQPNHNEIYPISNVKIISPPPSCRYSQPSEFYSYHYYSR
ncbi:Forkhead box protein B1 [Trichinella patagoniensis]|uniref:Forkhead box protein fkh-2 n=1 Tax=Trichinella patagoniensis TaxID=990121 RepID=A0A0V0ZY11_9BILA|nr:Forkhead box protein B1 [Trichinella patagoniensis]